MNHVNKALLTGTLVLALACSSSSDEAPQRIGTEEFGLTPAQLVESIEKVETLISSCMREQGFEYVAADYLTVRKGMGADKHMPGLGEEEFVSRYGFGVATLYTGEAPQLNAGYSPARIGLGERNVEIYKNLSATDQVAYNHALFGENSNTSFAYGLESEDFSRTGGCTRKAISQVFSAEELKASYYNPKDALINKDPRMKAALRYYGREMHKAGFDYNHPDEVESDIRDQLAILTNGGTLRVDDMTRAQREALTKLQDHERRAAAKSFELQKEVFDPVEERIQNELFSRKVI